VKYSIVCLLFSFFVQVAFGQELFEQQRIDSVHDAVETMSDDTNKLNALIDLCLDYAFISPDSGLQYGFRALGLAKQLNRKEEEATANRRIGQNYLILANYPKAIEYGLEALRVAKAANYNLVVISSTA
jgi:two-component system, NtrC family, sensor kinase